jgi:predicted NBD/HSP70 family sugar kinase
MSKIGTLSQEQIKEINRVNVINIIKKNNEITKNEIAHLLKLSIPTVTTNINALIEEGYVEEAGVAESTGGRKPIILKFNVNAKYSFGVNISPDRVSVVLMNLNSELLHNVCFMYRREYSFFDVLEMIENEIFRIIKEFRILKSNILGVGLSLPGLVDEDKLILENAPNIGVKDFDFTLFQERLGLKVFVENEANAAAYAETLESKHKNMNNVVYISITEGVGTGIIIDNHIYKSTNKKAGEFGHMRISEENIKCNCGRTGCWELFASKRALFKYYKEATGVRVSSLDNIFVSGNLDEPKVKIAINKYLDNLFIGIENIVLGLNPEYVVIGGELGKYKDEMLDFVNEKNKLKSAYMEYEGTRIIFSDLGDRGSLIGAGLLPFQEVFNYKKNVL